MTLRRLISKLLPTILLFTSFGTATAQTDSIATAADSVETVENINHEDSIYITADSIRIAASDTLTAGYRKYKRYKKREKWYQSFWNALMPNRFTLQYAGDIGMVSGGIGWCYGKRGQWGTHVLLGYLPKNHAPSSYWSFTVKQVYTPWSLPIGKKMTIEPFYGTLFLNSILSDEFWTKEPDRYPKGYYGFSSRIRIHLGIGQKFTFLIPANKRFLANKISLYYEVSTCDLYVRQKFLSKTVPFKDIISLAIGVQYTIL